MSLIVRSHSRTEVRYGCSSCYISRWAYSLYVMLDHFQYDYDCSRPLGAYCLLDILQMTIVSMLFFLLSVPLAMKIKLNVLEFIFLSLL